MTTHARLKDGGGIKGTLLLEVFGPDGRLRETREASNLIVNTGLDLLAQFVFQGLNPTDQPAPPTSIAVGSSAVAVSNADTALGTELTRQEFDTVTIGGVGVITVSTRFAAGVGTGTWAEAGILNEDDILLDRVTFAAVSKAADDAIRCSFSFTFASA